MTHGPVGRRAAFFPMQGEGRTMTDQRDTADAAPDGVDANGNPTDLSIQPVPEQPPMDDAAGGPQAKDDDEDAAFQVQGGE